MIARVGGVAQLVFKLEEISPDKLYWYYVDSHGNKRVIAKTENMKKFNVHDTRKFNAYRFGILWLFVRRTGFQLVYLF